MTTEKIKQLPVIGILRGIKEEHLEPVIESVLQSGLKCIEITMNTDDADNLISKTIKLAGNKLTIGAGTVYDMSGLKRALDAGAEFIVMPVTVENIIEHCVKNRIPVFPGALTPTEIFHAWNMGATMVKVFPASAFGPKYFREVKAPFNDIELMATGGVSADNISEFFTAGASAAAFGASIFKKEWIENREFNKIKEGIESIIKGYTDWKLKS